MLQKERTRTLDLLALDVRAGKDAVRASVVRLAQLGQVMPDVVGGAVRFRSILDTPLSSELLGDEPREVSEGRRLFVGRDVSVAKQDVVGTRRFLQATASGFACEGLIDLDGALTKARCGCSHFHRFGLKKGPCRHLLALRLFAQSSIQ